VAGKSQEPAAAVPVVNR